VQMMTLGTEAHVNADGLGNGVVSRVHSILHSPDSAVEVPDDITAEGESRDVYPAQELGGRPVETLPHDGSANVGHLLNLGRRLSSARSPGGANQTGAVPPCCLARRKARP
jgi:hypothetical protein